ncbi:hypothetical protein BCR22_10060 [Enterococcus plantarum]|uniref:Gram-positive cocci surface proteins LPxTG domain-containing protein n=1 Tax=Enterococcus plantarum TaxID=1077675 RepID=A0A2W4BXC4_9ENTE|nr:LPXTG cell wall anchor domain-containing protein [Enterococcus plantarum]MBO0466857.1 LPXTG cell wall anchor domain-containing protein [Enterococcus plantarum]OEG19064.1 hypothetical protein BCR22_10060 [Enterococcus plantarum]PZL78279.1 hypothetical protein CI088_00490 [Enterococcus plantarum]
MCFTKEKSKALITIFLTSIISLFYYPNTANSETIVSEVTVEVHRDTSTLEQVVQGILPKTNEELGLFLSWIGGFLLIGFVVLISFYFVHNKYS